MEFIFQFFQGLAAASSFPLKDVVVLLTVALLILGIRELSSSRMKKIDKRLIYFGGAVLIILILIVIHFLPETSENLKVSFRKGAIGAITTYTYQGETIITVSGTGEAAGSSRSDALYIFTDGLGNNVSPYHIPSSSPNNFSLCIDSQPIDNFMKTPLPLYNSSHTYTFTIDAPGGPLTFGVCDGDAGDNMGSFTINVEHCQYLCDLRL